MLLQDSFLITYLIDVQIETYRYERIGCFSCVGKTGQYLDSLYKSFVKSRRSVH